MYQNIPHSQSSISHSCANRPGSGLQACAYSPLKRLSPFCLLRSCGAQAWAWACWTNALPISTIERADPVFTLHPLISLYIILRYQGRLHKYRKYEAKNQWLILWNGWWFLFYFSWGKVSLCSPRWQEFTMEAHIMSQPSEPGVQVYATIHAFNTSWWVQSFISWTLYSAVAVKTSHSSLSCWSLHFTFMPPVI